MFLTRVFIGVLAAAALGAGASGSAAAPRANYGATLFADVQAAQSSVTRTIGTIKTIMGNTVTLTTDAGTDVTVTVSDATKMVQVAPGQKTLQGATAIHLSDLQVGDRILVLAQALSGGGPLNAGSIIAMKKSAVDAQHAQQNAEWQRGVGGLVKNVDPASGAITITVTTLGGTKAIAIHTTKDTILRRYAPDSVKFDDAKPGTFDQIRAGDQLRARGVRNADGSELDAQEIVSGAFRNIAGTITAIDTGANTLNVMDLISKKPYLVKFTTQSEIRQLSPQMAQGIAMRLRASQNGGQQANGGGAAQGGSPGADGQSNGAGQRPAGFQRRGGTGDLQQMLSRLPAVQLANLQKGEAVMIVSTEGAVSGEVTAITLLGGVEPILEAPSGVQAMTLSPWSLGGTPAEGDDQQP
jgi:Cu/Ag efflux protein CusF